MNDMLVLMRDAALLREPALESFRDRKDAMKRGVAILLAGPVALVLDGYLSAGTELHWMNLPEERVPPEDLPKEGPFPASASLIRRELRLHVPFAVALRLSESEKSDVDLLFGGNAWWVLTHGDAIDPKYPDYAATRGVEFSVGLGFR